jgi:hypothetical protein
MTPRKEPRMYAETFWSQTVTLHEAAERLGVELGILEIAISFGGLPFETTRRGAPVVRLQDAIEAVLQEQMFDLRSSLHDWVEKQEAAGKDVRRYKCHVCCGDEGGPDVLCAFHRTGTDLTVEVLM